MKIETLAEKVHSMKTHPARQDSIGPHGFFDLSEQRAKEGGLASRNVFIYLRIKFRTRNGEKQTPDKTVIILQIASASNLPRIPPFFPAAKQTFRYSNFAIKEHLKTGHRFFTAGLKQSLLATQKS